MLKKSLLTLALPFAALLLNGCGATEADLYGSYSGTTDLIDVWNGMEDNTALDNYLALNRESLSLGDAFTINWELTLNEDHTYSMTYTTVQDEAAAATVIDALNNGLDMYYKDIKGQIAVNTGTESTEISPELQAEVDELKKEIAADFNDIIGSSTTETFTGQYTAEDGMLSMSRDVNTAPAADANAVSYPYILNGDTLTISYAEGITLTRQK